MVVFTFKTKEMIVTWIMLAVISLLGLALLLHSDPFLKVFGVLLIFLAFASMILFILFSIDKNGNKTYSQQDSIKFRLRADNIACRNGVTFCRYELHN